MFPIFTMRRILTLVPATFLLLALTGCKDGKISMHSFDGSKTVTMSVEFADTPSERERGLMQRTTLDPESGMLFVFPNADALSFWMKNTVIPLEILFFDENGDFVNALSMVPCKVEPCQTYKSAAISKYALEVVPDFRVKHGIGVGWKLDLATVSKNSSPR